MHKAGIKSGNPVLPSEALQQFTPPDVVSDDVKSIQLETRYGVHMGELNMLIPEQGGSEVLLQPPVFNIPHTPLFFLGVCNIRGNIVPIYDLFLAYVLKRANEQTNDDDQEHRVPDRRSRSRQKRILILGSGEQSIGLAIELLPIVVPVTEETQRINELQPLPDRLMKFVLGGYVIDNRHWYEIDFLNLIKDLSGND